MIIDVIDIVGVTLLETKDDTPVRPDSNGPEAFKIACQAVQSEAGQIHVFMPPGSVENGEDIFHFLSMIGADPLRISRFEQPFQSFVPEATNHDLWFMLYHLRLTLPQKRDKRQLSQF